MLARWREADQMFVETRASKHVLTSLKENCCVTVTGSSGVGKTATVRHIALQMEKDGYDLVPIKGPSRVFDYNKPIQKTLFIIDDFCGTFVLNQTFVDKWKAVSKHIERILKNKKFKLVVTCRHQVYKDDKFKVLSLFQSCECDIMSQNTCLLLEERLSIATNYLENDAEKISQFVELYPFFPLLCTLYKKNPSVDITEFFKNPFTVYEAELDKLFSEGACGKYCCLLLIVMFNNKIKEQWFTSKIQEDVQTVIENALEACKMSRGTSRLVIKDDLDSLVHTFLKKENSVYKTLHDKLFDFISFYFGTKMLSVIIKSANSNFIRERFLYERESNSKMFKIFIQDIFRKVYLERVFRDWEQGQVVHVFCNNNMEVTSFRENFKSHLRSLPKSHQKQLACICDVDNNDTVLIQCCFIGDIDLVQWCICHCNSGGIVNKLLHKISDINNCREDGASPLSIACEKGHREIVNVLLDSKSDINKCMSDGRSPLFIACQSGHSEIVNLLLDRKAKINKCKKNGTSPLHIACQKGHTDIACVLLGKKAKINKCREDGASALYTACWAGHSEIVNMLLDAKQDFNKCTKNGSSPLFIASQEGHREIVNLLLHRKADVNQCTYTGSSPLFISCELGHSEIVNALLDKKSDINKCRDTGASPLFIACQEGNSDIVNILLDRRADFNKCKNDETSPLLISCYKGYIDIVKFLLDKGDNINKCRADGKTPLLCACWQGHANIVELLLKRGADVNLCKSGS